MKYWICNIFIYTFFWYTSISLHGQSVYFNKTIDLGQDFGAGHSILELDSIYYISAVRGGTVTNIGLISLDLTGNTNWTKSYGHAGMDYYDGRPGSMKLFRNKLLLGGSRATGDTSESVLLLFNSDGDTNLSKYYSPQNSEYMIFNSSAPTLDSGYIFTGEYANQNSNTDVLLLKTDSLGNELWRTSWGWNTSDKGFSVIQSPDSGYIVGGYTYQPGQDNSGNPLVVKFDQNGAFQWFRRPGGPLDDKQAMVCSFNDTTFLCLTIYSDSSLSAEAEYGRIRLIKYSFSGIVIWDKLFGNSMLDNSVGNIKAFNEGEIVCCGYNIDSTEYYRFGWIFRLTGEGDSLWMRNYAYYKSNFGKNYLFDIYPTSDNGFISCGKALADPPNDLQKIWVLKVDSLGCDSAGCDPNVGVEDLHNHIFIKYGDDEEILVFPNPAKDWVSFRMPENVSEGEFTVTIYNIMGQDVLSRLIYIQESTTSFNISSLKPGVYYAIFKDKLGLEFKGKFVVHR